MENAIVDSRSGGLLPEGSRDSLGGGGHSAESKALLSLRDSLRERLAIIQDEESRHDTNAHMARLQAVSEKIEQLRAALPQPVDPQLAHYLQRKSYDKALELIELL